MTTRLYIGGISAGTTEETLRGWFTAHGLVVQAVHIVHNRATGLGRGFAFAEFDGKDDADATARAIVALGGDGVDGRIPHFKGVPLKHSL